MKKLLSILMVAVMIVGACLPMSVYAATADALKLAADEEHPYPSSLLGDADDDFDVSVLDATVIQRFLAEIPVTVLNEYTADADEDGDVNIVDSTWILRYLANFPLTDRIGKDRKNMAAIDSFRWKPFDKAYYIFVNDDAKRWLHVAYDVFHAHGEPLGAAVIADNIMKHNDTETPSDRTIKDTLDLIVADGGEVLVHYSADLLKTDPYELWYNTLIRDSKKVIDSYGYTTRGLILANRSSRTCDVGEEICERYFDYADNVGTKTQYKIVRTQFSETSTVADVKKYIDKTVKTPGVYPIMMHGPTAEPWTTAEGLDEILTYIEETYSSTAVISTYSYVYDTFGTNDTLEPSAQ